MSQEELAARSGLTARTISNLERGTTRRPHPKSLRRIADALQLPGESYAEFIAAAHRNRPGQPAFFRETGQLANGITGPEMLPPRQLPAAKRAFLGRDTEMAKLSDILESGTAQAAAAPVVVAISGRAGVGKTALALAWAHRVADRFQDGQLYANLGTFDGDIPASTSEVLGRFLRTFGLPWPAIPATTEERAAAFRSLLAGHRLLIMLDDVRDAEQVRLLIPGGPAYIIVTSRNALAGIAAHDGATPLALDPLPLGESLLLLRELIGARVDAAAGAALRLARSCHGLPLTLRIAAELSFVQPDAPLDALASQLTMLRDCLLTQHSGSVSSEIFRSVFEKPYWHLDRVATQAFQRAGVGLSATDRSCYRIQERAPSRVWPL